jgi:hypothetical protein
LKYGILLVLLLTGCNVGNPGNGEKIGQIARIVDEGIFCKTTTVLVTGKFGGGELKVTVPNENVALKELVLHFQDTQEQVKVRYHGELFKGACSNETENQMMDSIERHSEGAAK